MGTETEGLGGSAKGIPHCVYRSTIGDAILGFQQLLGTKKRKEKEMAKNSIRENKNAAWFSNQENVRTHFFGRTLTIHSRPSWPPCLHYVPITRRRRWGGMNDDEAYNQRSEQKDEKKHPPWLSLTLTLFEVNLAPYLHIFVIRPWK